MRNILKLFIMPLLVGAAIVFASSPPALAACPEGGSSKRQVLAGAGQTGSDCSGAGVNKTIKTIINLLSYVVGIVSVIMIIIGGFKYITSGGGSEGVASAKSTIIYALIGLVVVILAQFLVQFVLARIKVS